MKIYYNIKHFFKNLWHFKKALWEYRWYDYQSILTMLKVSIDGMYPNVEKHGWEVDETRLPKVKAMKRASELLKNFIENKFIEKAEKELGELVINELLFEDIPDKPGYSRLIDNYTIEEKLHNGKVYDKAHQIKEQQWNELFLILKGNKNNNGKGIRTWWD